MTVDYLSILAVIAVLSVVQSLFGMGVLVFGTPTLLLMGYDFVTTLSYLLPASFAISLLQVVGSKAAEKRVSPYLYWLCLPGIGVGFWLTEIGPLASWTHVLIGFTLLFSALLRFRAPSRTKIGAFLDRSLPAYHLVMGLVHGLTNLGGALLAILAAARSSDKGVIRNTVAHYYLAFSTVQMGFMIVVMGQGGLLLTHGLTALVSASVYLLIGRRIFIRTPNPAYNATLTAFIAAYGLVVLWKSY